MNKLESEIANIIIASNGKLTSDEVKAIIFNQIRIRDHKYYNSIKRIIS